MKSFISFYNGGKQICKKAIKKLATDTKSGFAVVLDAILNPDSYDEDIVSDAKDILAKIVKKCTKFTIWHDKADEPEVIAREARDYHSILGFKGDIRPSVATFHNKQNQPYEVDITSGWKTPKPDNAPADNLHKAMNKLGLDQR